MPTYKIEYHRVWITTIEAESRKQARQIAQDEMCEQPEAEDYSYSVVKKTTTVNSAIQRGKHNTMRCAECRL